MRAALAALEAEPAGVSPQDSIAGQVAARINSLPLTPGGPVVVEGNRWWDPPNDSLLGPAAPGVVQHEMVAAAALLRRYGRRAGGSASGGNA